MIQACSEPSLFDSHCHLNDPRLSAGLPAYLERAFKAGVRRVLVVACDELSSYQALNMTGEANGVEIWASAGIHPHEAKTAASGLSEELLDLSVNENIKAIGECGLDYYYDHSPREVQQLVFAEQIQWAKNCRKPLIIHLRNAGERDRGDAYKDALSLLKEMDAGVCGGVIHCFSSNQEDAFRSLDLGFYISFAGTVTYPKSEELRRIIKKVPLERILCETDSPYLAPQRYRGKQNEPAYVRETYELLADIKGMSLQSFSKIVWENGERLFKNNGASANV